MTLRSQNSLFCVSTNVYLTNYLGTALRRIFALKKYILVVLRASTQRKNTLNFTTLSAVFAVLPGI